MQDNEQGMLVARGRELRLPKDRAFIVGRGSEADAAIEDKRISRQHALVSFHDDAYYICDLKSHNGTYVNGKRISASTRLKVTDEVRIYPFRFVFIISQVEEGENDAADVGMDTTTQHPFSGTLSAVPLPDLVQLFHTTARSGELRVLDAKGESMAQLQFADGETIHIAYGDLENDDAFYKLYPLREGRFEFEPGEPKDVANRMTTDTMSILLAACQKEDESGAAAEIEESAAQLPEAAKTVDVAEPKLPEELRINPPKKPRRVKVRKGFEKPPFQVSP